MAQGSIGYLFDENFSPKLVSVLRILGEPGLRTVVKEFGYGAKDPDWLPKAAEYGHIYVTADRRQLRDQHVAEVSEASRVRAVFLPRRFAQARKWEQALWLLKHWRRIRSETAKGDPRYVRR